jgi:hypothetical protein
MRLTPKKERFLGLCLGVWCLIVTKSRCANLDWCGQRPTLQQTPTTATAPSAFGRHARAFAAWLAEEPRF